ncbi:hypothetical protein ACFX13_023867 [Malus domestica]
MELGDGKHTSRSADSGMVDDGGSVAECKVRGRGGQGGVEGGYMRWFNEEVCEVGGDGEDGQRVDGGRDGEGGEEGGS